MLGNRRGFLFRLADITRDGTLGLRIKGQAARDFERFQIGDIHLRRHPRQRARNIHLDRHAQLGVRHVPGGRLRVGDREWGREAQ